MDAWYNKDKLFASVWIVVKKKMGVSNEYYQIPEPTVVKYNASHDAKSLSLLYHASILS